MAVCDQTLLRTLVSIICIIKVSMLYIEKNEMFIFLRSAETVNDGNFHTVELVTFNQMVNLSVDGGEPTTLDGHGRGQLVTGETPLYVGGKRGWVVLYLSSNINLPAEVMTGPQI